MLTILSEFPLSSPVEASTDDQDFSISYGMYMNALDLLYCFYNLEKHYLTTSNSDVLWGFCTDYNTADSIWEFYKVLV